MIPIGIKLIYCLMLDKLFIQDELLYYYCDILNDYLLENDDQNHPKNHRLSQWIVDNKL